MENGSANLCLCCGMGVSVGAFGSLSFLIAEMDISAGGIHYVRLVI